MEPSAALGVVTVAVAAAPIKVQIYFFTSFFSFFFAHMTNGNYVENKHIYIYYKGVPGYGF